MGSRTEGLMRKVEEEEEEEEEALIVIFSVNCKGKK
jgi:hypothetical protein